MEIRLDQWAAIANAIPKPWPLDAVIVDLRWWAAQGGRPGRVVLADRWGRPERWVRGMIEADASPERG